MKHVDKKMISRADCILSNSDFTACRAVKLYGIPLPKTIYPGVNITDFPEAPVKKEGYFLCVSSLSKFKNIGQVIQTIFLLKQKGISVKLIIIGEGPEKRQLEQQAEQSGLAENIIFTGSIQPRRTLYSYYARASCVVFPSIDEAFGIVPLESMAAWTPVIAYNSGGPVESIVDGESGFLIHPGSTGELEEKMLFFIQNPSIAESMGISARKNVSRKFSWDTTREQLSAVFSRYVK
jgi:glycosyltransferase involved in cell wall biosynthesis